MPKKKLYKKGGIVYSTAEDFSYPNEEENEEFLPANEQRLLRSFLIKSIVAEKWFLL